MKLPAEGPGSPRWFGRAALLVALPLPLALATAWWHPRRPDFSPLPVAADAAADLDLATVRARFPDALWIDAREAEPFAAGHVPAALSLNETAWEAGFAAVVEAWDGERAIVVYCGGESCHASHAVAARLRRELGADNIVVLRGGWPAWLAAGGETAR